jgi:hypothetical protein
VRALVFSRVRYELGKAFGGLPQRCILQVGEAHRGSGLGMPIICKLTPLGARSIGRGRHRTGTSMSALDGCFDGPQIFRGRGNNATVMRINRV